MKTARKTALTAARRLILRFQIWNLEIMIASREDVMRMVDDRLTLANMDTAQMYAHAELRRLYTELRK